MKRQHLTHQRQEIAPFEEVRWCHSLQLIANFFFFKQTADSDIVSIYQVSSMQLMINK